MMSSPIIDDNGDVEFFASVEDAERYLEPWVVEEDFVTYDSEGRLLKLAIARAETSTFFGWGRTVLDYVVIESAEDGPNHAPQLRAVLLDFFERVGISPGADTVPLGELVRRGVEHIGFTI